MASASGSTSVTYGVGNPTETMTWNYSLTTTTTNPTYACGDYVTTLTDEFGDPIDASIFTFTEIPGSMTFDIYTAVNPPSYSYTIHAVISLIDYPIATFPGVTEETDIFNISILCLPTTVDVTGVTITS